MTSAFIWPVFCVFLYFAVTFPKLVLIQSFLKRSQSKCPWAPCGWIVSISAGCSHIFTIYVISEPVATVPPTHVLKELLDFKKKEISDRSL